MILLPDPVHQDLAGTFAGLMDLYERNYISIRRLVPVVPPANTGLVSQAPGGLDLHLQVIERFRYTTELSLTYYFVRPEGRIPEPDLCLRIYHDARLAEVMSGRLRHWPAFEMAEEAVGLQHLRARWRVNRFLYKWLGYCLHQGHRFPNRLPVWKNS